MRDELDKKSLKEIEESTEKTISIKAEEYDDYNEFVADKIKTISPTLIVMMTDSPRDSQILNAVQALWLKEFWESRSSSPGMKN